MTEGLSTAELVNPFGTKTLGSTRLSEQYWGLTRTLLIFLIVTEINRQHAARASSLRDEKAFALCASHLFLRGGKKK